MRACPRCGSSSSRLALYDPDKWAVWTEAFYDTDYGRDQIDHSRRAAIFNGVVEFLLSIGCQLKRTCCWDGSDFDPEYGWIISDVTYQGKHYDHDPCFQVRSELPTELVEKLDAKFATEAK
jgi:hypothetical protein